MQGRIQNFQLAMLTFLFKKISSIQKIQFQYNNGRQLDKIFQDSNHFKFFPSFFFFLVFQHFLKFKNVETGSSVVDHSVQCLNM